MRFWSQLAEHLSSGEPAFVALVGDHTRHSPGTRGAKMFVRPDGSQVGTIGGGAMEAELLRQAQSWGGREGTEVTTLHHRADAAGVRSGLICAGRQTIVTAELHPEHALVLEQFVAQRDQGEIELRVGDSLEVAAAPVGAAAPIRLDGESYCEHAVNHRRVAIAGGGHCGVALSRVLRSLGYFVRVFETRPDVFTLQDVDADDVVVVDDYSAIGPHIDFPSLTHCIVMTSDMPSDVRALYGLRGVDAPFVGVMGSSAKIRRIKSELSELGADDVRDRLIAPIGLEMTSNTPPEIAVSVSAQLLRLRETLFEWERPSPLDSV